jgi:hypothetical protein
MRRIFLVLAAMIFVIGCGDDQSYHSCDRDGGVQQVRDIQGVSSVLVICKSGYTFVTP